jgi:hypothetical protein
MEEWKLDHGSMQDQELPLVTANECAAHDEQGEQSALRERSQVSQRRAYPGHPWVLFWPQWCAYLGHPPRDRAELFPV